MIFTGSTVFLTHHASLKGIKALMCLYVGHFSEGSEEHQSSDDVSEERNLSCSSVHLTGKSHKEGRQKLLQHVSTAQYHLSLQKHTWLCCKVSSSIPFNQDHYTALVSTYITLPL